MICLFAKQERWQEEPNQSSEKIKRTNSNLENLEQRNTAEQSSTKKACPKTHKYPWQSWLSCVSDGVFRWTVKRSGTWFRHTSRPIKSWRELLGTISESIVEIGVECRYFLGIGICIISALVFFNSSGIGIGIF